MTINDAVAVELKPRYVQAQDRSLHPVFDPVALDDAWLAYSRVSKDLRAPLLLDLAKIRYIDHDCLLHMAGLVRFRSLRGLETYFGLPTEKFVFEYLRAWDFPMMIGLVTGTSFRDLLSKQDAERYDTESQIPPQYIEVMETPGGGREGMLMRKQLAITPINVKENDLKVATVAQYRWRESQLIGLLNRYLDGKGNRIADQIVREVVLNAVHHPDAKLAFTSAQFGRPPSWLRAAPARLQFAIWDDGLAIGETLSEAHRRGKFTSEGYGIIKETFRVHLVRSSNSESVRILNWKNVHSVNDTPGHIVSAFLAGVTSKPAQRTDSQFRADDEAAVPPRAGGFGLRHLRKNVIDLFGGTISYRTTNYRLKMEGDGAPDHYKVHIAFMPRSSWYIKGNLLAIDIPLTEMAIS